MGGGVDDATSFICKMGALIVQLSQGCHDQMSAWSSARHLAPGTCSAHTRCTVTLRAFCFIQQRGIEGLCVRSCSRELSPAGGQMSSTQVEIVMGAVRSFLLDRHFSSEVMVQLSPCGTVEEVGSRQRNSMCKADI